MLITLVNVDMIPIFAAKVNMKDWLTLIQPNLVAFVGLFKYHSIWIFIQKGQEIELETCTDFIIKYIFYMGHSL